MDTNSDGRLDLKEMRLGMNKFTSLFQMKELDIEKIFREMDSDQNGFIEYSEFLSAAMDHQIYLNEANLLKAFKILDKDGNGNIDKNELHEALGSKGLTETEQN